MQEGTPKRKVHIDERLFERIRQGEQDAFRVLYEISYKPLYAFLLSYTQNAEDAKDLLQDTYIQVFKNCHMYHEKGNPMAWMMKIAKNLYLMQSREKKKAVINYEDMKDQLSFDNITNVDNRIVLEKMFELLSIEDRNLIIMHDIGGLTYREIAKLLALPLGTVLSRYHRVIRKLRKEFGEKL